MVQPRGCSKSQEFYEYQLPSNLFLQSLHRDKEIQIYNNDIETYKSKNNTKEIISKIDASFEKIRQDIINNYNTDEIKCCMDMNYYADLLDAIIKSPDTLSKQIQNNLISKIHQEWVKILQVKNIEECTRETDLDSIRKRCILKHMHDLNIDKDHIIVYSNQYKKYLGDKWGKIIRYTNPHIGGLYIKIETDSMGIIEKYDYFLDSSEYICDNGIDKLSTDDITISTDVDSIINTISLEVAPSNNVNKACYNEKYIEMLKIKASRIQRMNNHLCIGIALLGFSLILIFLYRFSPLGNLLRRFMKKKIEVDENMSDEIMSELYENSQNERQYITYHSSSH
ncbi:PIR Superfamily Protein [Plasmodium ovale wallikeri]|uniref:PIR Superfamily Protein n=1 Tax=Plasmodium ovale wallikeri TaxID=864142 RepID=A0A1A9AAW9_PLAOA|nr:PIR Superfamily Protein [Plasmodium ovale wallikeri]